METRMKNLDYFSPISQRVQSSKVPKFILEKVKA